jgi:MFS family permease
MKGRQVSEETLQASLDSPRSGPENLRHNRDFLLFLFSRGNAVTANHVLAVALGWHVYERTGDVWNLGLIGLFMFLPVFCLFLFAGLAADRLDRRLIIGVCNITHCIATVAIGVYLMTGSEAIWPVFGLLLVTGSAQAFLHPALLATLPNIVPREIFAHAVATMSSVNKLAQLGGPALGGLLIALIDEAVYVVAGGMFLLAALSAFLIRANLRVTGSESFGLAVILGGFRHIWRTKPVLAAISIDLVAVLFGGVMGILPVFAIDILKVGPEALGFMRAMPAAGALVVALMLARSGLPWSVGRAFFVSLTIFGLSILVFSVSTIFWLSAAALAVYGAADMVSVYVRQTLVQIETPNELRGRVSAVSTVSITASNQLGDFRAGGMAALIGAPAAVALGAGVTLAATALWYRWFPGLRAVARF